MSSRLQARSWTRGMVLALCLIVMRGGVGASASTDIVLNVAQPLVGYDMGVSIGFEAYGGYWKGDADHLVVLTCAENSTRVLGHNHLGMGVANRNAASLVGLSIRCAEPAMSGDTLRVVLTIPESAITRETMNPHGWGVLGPLRDLVCTTIECARINAASGPIRADERAKFLEVAVVGWDDVSDLSGTYSLDRLTPLGELPPGFARGGRSLREVCPKE